MQPLLQVLFQYFDFMKSDLIAKSSKHIQLKPLKGKMEREGGLEHREAMCKFMRILQKKQRGALEEEISNGPKNPLLFRHGGKGGSWKGSLAQSRRLSRCIIHAENERAIQDSLAQREAEKSLIIKNLHLSCSTSNKRLQEIHKNRPRLGQNLIKLQMDSIHKSDEPQLFKSHKKQHEKHRHRLVKIEQAARIKTEGDVASLCLDYRHNIKKKHFFFNPPEQKGLDNLSRINIALDKSVPLNDISLSLKSSQHREDRSDTHCNEISLLEHQNDYLKIKRLKHNLNGNKLYHTENPKAESLAPDSPTFRKYSQIEHLE